MKSYVAWAGFWLHQRLANQNASQQHVVKSSRHLPQTCSRKWTNAISIGLAVFAGHTVVRNIQADRQIYRPCCVWTCMEIGCIYALSASDAALITTATTPTDFKKLTAVNDHALPHNYATKCPLVTMGCLKFHPKRPFLWRSPPHLIHPSLDWPHSPSQMASRSNQLFCHSTLSGPTDTHTETDRWARRQVYTISIYSSTDREWRAKKWESQWCNVRNGFANSKQTNERWQKSLLHSKLIFWCTLTRI